MIKFIINLFKRKKSKYYFEILKVKPKIKNEFNFIKIFITLLIVTIIILVMQQHQTTQELLRIIAR